MLSYLLPRPAIVIFKAIYILSPQYISNILKLSSLPITHPIMVAREIQLSYCNASNPCYLFSVQNYQVLIISYDQRHSVRLTENLCLAGMRSDAPCLLLGMCIFWESGIPPPHSFSSPYYRQAWQINYPSKPRESSLIILFNVASECNTKH
jgi:hypothetical protein